MKLFRIFKEIGNYFFIKKTINKNKDTEAWKKHNLRVGYFGIIYTVVNLPPEVFESEEQYYKMYVIEQIKPINEYLASLNLQEVVTLKLDDKVNRDKGEYAYGIKYVPLFRDLTFGWVLRWSALITILLWAQFKFSLIEKAKDLGMWLFHLVHP